MIINPSFLYPDLAYATWRYAARFPKHMHSHPVLNIRCMCMTKDLPLSAIDAMPVEQMTVQLITMNVDFFQNKFAADDVQRVKVWTGKCALCKNIFWTCDSFAWAGWMTDLQAVTMLTGAVPLKHLVVDTGRYIVVQGDTRIWFDVKGKIKEVR